MTNTPTLKFGDFSFPHNPTKLEILHSRKVEQIATPFHGVQQKVAAESIRIVTGEGEFFGSDAAYQLQRFSSLFQAPLCLLVIPDYGSFYAFFSDLTVLRQAGESVLYSFTFTEEARITAIGQALSTAHQVKKDENLFSIAGLYGKTVEELLVKNPGLVSPFAITEGDWIQL